MYYDGSNPFEIFGLGGDASREELDAAYRQLRDELREKRFSIGQEGQEASEKLQVAEQAYKDALNILDRRGKENYDPYESVKQLIREGKCDEAQDIIDKMGNRDAEWHYIQSTIFFKKSWFLEAKKQLEFAVQLDPKNGKYTEALDRLTRYLASNSVSPDQLRTTTRPAGQGMGVGGINDNGTCTGSCCGDACLANLCANCICGGCR